MFNNSSDEDSKPVDYNIEIKIVILGESGVGKSNLIIFLILLNLLKLKFFLIIIINSN